MNNMDDYWTIRSKCDIDNLSTFKDINMYNKYYFYYLQYFYKIVLMVLSGDEKIKYRNELAQKIVEDRNKISKGGLWNTR